jgi:hypothetical protein
MRLGNILAVTSFLVLGAIIGWVLATQYEASRDLIQPQAGVGGGPAPTQVTSNTKASDFRVQVQALVREHTTLAGQYVQKIIEGEDPSVLKSALDKNTQMLSGIISSVYNGNSGTDFNMLWNDHIQAYADYTNAVKNNDADDKLSIRNSLAGMSDDFERLMDSINQIPVDSIGIFMQDHVLGTLSLADAAEQQDEAKVVDLSNKNLEQAGKFADYLSEIVISEKPDLFR